ncbi:sulfurtransferase complex subunit TusB [Exilibacterium tricleocarpae]|uniref:Sulfurtransferase complex subunit TusB n=1 Tax=Exilibacterium tricleocarpae TaxID=2591008 RepID=A0A545T8D5_9GAMM|nr:sulfurtransferase complex subunit TusB [Exilibacterium tricleocarpae]TQV73458.1 sulfurtransferase complex subunit TusB [Exilibacterium tricleocarpae]
MILHTVNKSPFSHSLLEACLAIMGAKHSLLLLEDGVYGTLKTSPMAAALAERGRAGAIYALEADLRARGLTDTALLSCVKPIDYAGFVRLATEHSKVQSWF